jgi:hypothetical protein
LIDQRNLFVHPGTKVHRYTQRSEGINRLDHLILRDSAELRPGSSNDPDADSFLDRDPEVIRPARRSATRQEWRRNYDGLVRPLKIRRKRPIKRGLGEHSESIIR